MLTAANIKLIKSLSQKKFRKEYGLFLAEGEKIVSELMHDPSWHIEHIYALDHWLLKNKPPATINATVVSARDLERISTLISPNNALAVVKIPRRNQKNIKFKDKITLMLDNIQDPGNLGTIIRTADWFGVENIICSENTVELFNPKVIQATMGSFARVKLYYTQLANFLSTMPDQLPVMGAVLDGSSIYTSELPKEGVLITGNESKGISPELMNFISHKIKIPLIHSTGKANFPESLNAAVATGIILSHISK